VTALLKQQKVWVLLLQASLLLRLEQQEQQQQKVQHPLLKLQHEEHQ
jgi:hypothetical protein